MILTSSKLENAQVDIIEINTTEVDIILSHGNVNVCSNGLGKRNVKYDNRNLQNWYLSSSMM